MSSPAKTPCPKCWHMDTTIVCRFCKISKIEGEPKSFHDFRDQGDPMVKVHPDPEHWTRRQQEPTWTGQK